MNIQLSRARRHLYEADDSMETALALLQRHLELHPNDLAVESVVDLLRAVRPKFMDAYVLIAEDAYAPA